MSDAGQGEPGLFEVMRTTRSMRRLKPDPVPEALVRRLLEAGTAAPSGGNAQRWRFIVVRDPEVKKAAAACYKRAWDEQGGPRYRASTPPATSTRRRCGLCRASRTARTLAAAPPARRSTRPCRTYCWRRARSVSARR